MKINLKKCLYILLLTLIVCFVALIVIIRVFFWEISGIINNPRFSFLHIEVKTNQSENKRTVYYVWGTDAGQKYKLKDGVVYDYYEFDKHNDFIMNNSMYAIWDLRKKMKPYRWLPARTKIDNNATMIIHGCGLRGLGDYLFWSGSIENAPDGILPILEILDQQTELATPTNGMMFVQAIPNKKFNPKTKRMLTSDFSKEGQEIINNAFYYPYRLQFINQNDFSSPLVDSFQLIEKPYDASYNGTHFYIRFLPYSIIENGKPHPVREQTPQGTQP